ncbi:MAG: hypothetical protein M1826_007285 [Phylliscum demangeonii]|nr:MAG: hypothetical protein M1826_007285 [Phylliscum demangeonii]
MEIDFRIRWSWCLALFLAWPFANGFYVPGWSIKSYKDNEAIPLFVNKVYSDNTQLQYAYYDLPFVCPPSGRRSADTNLVSGHSISLNLGEVLRGDRIRNSDYDLNMGQDQECRHLCTQTVDRRGVKRAKELVANGYVAEWIVDNLPGATTFVTVDKTRKYYAAGFKTGYKDYSPTTARARYFLYNHVTIVLRWRKASGRDGELGRKVLVGFEVYPKSIGAGDRNAEGCPNHLRDDVEGLELSLPSNRTEGRKRYPHSSYTPKDDEAADADDLADGTTLTVPYTYSVYFREDDKIEWANRWDLYFVHQENSSKIHWLAILNSLVISGLLTAIVAVIFARTVRSDIKGRANDGLEEGGAGVKLKRARKRRPLSGRQSPRVAAFEKATGGLLEQADADHDADVSSDDDDVVEEITGWKLLHGDVFRPPPHGDWLAPLIGSGMQLVFMAAGLLVLSCLGILNPSFRGGFVSVGAALFLGAGGFSGYFSGRLYRTFGGQQWRNNALMTAVLVPGLLFTLIFILNLFVWAQASSTAIPFSTLVALAALWLFIQLPLVYGGSWLGYVRAGPWEQPTKTHVVARAVPRQRWYYHGRCGAVGVLLAGLLPFAVVFIELLFVFRSVWQDKSGYYYVFGFLAVVSLILGLTVVEVTVVATYLQLCSEDHHWWWRSFLVGGCSSVWVFLYSIWYFYAKLHIHGFVSSMLFFSYSLLACAVYGLLTGTIGFVAAYAFVRRIYG